jgi:hypothetical protein
MLPAVFMRQTVTQAILDQRRELDASREQAQARGKEAAEWERERSR